MQQRMPEDGRGHVEESADPRIWVLFSTKAARLHLPD